MDGTAEPQDWRSLWLSAAAEAYVTHVMDEARVLRESQSTFTDPRDTVAMACAAAEGAGAASEALDGGWALYTPLQAAAVASAAFAQVQAGAEALQRLARAVQRLAERGDLDEPRRGVGQPWRAAVDQLTSAAGRLVRVVACQAQPTTAALAALPSAITLPADAHQTIAAVAGLLGKQARLIQRHAAGAEVAGPDAGQDCGCDLNVRYAGEEWTFYRSDSAWSLVRQRDAKRLPDGSLVFSSFIDLPVTDATAHPAHLVALIEEALRAAVGPPGNGAARPA